MMTQDLTQDPTAPDLSGMERELQVALQSNAVQVQLRAHQEHLDITLTRPQGTKVSYPDLVRQIQTLLRSRPQAQFHTLTISGQVKGLSDLEWSMTSRIDEDELINQVLKHDLALLQVKTLVRRKHDHLHILLTRSQEISVNYAAVMRLIRDDLRRLKPSGISGITVYGRKQDHTGYEWQVTSRLEEDGDRDRDGTTIHMPIRKVSQPPTPITVARRDKLNRRWISSVVGLFVFLLMGILCLILVA